MNDKEKPKGQVSFIDCEFSDNGVALEVDENIQLSARRTKFLRNKKGIQILRRYPLGWTGFALTIVSGVTVAAIAKVFGLV